jgi:ComF family protein
MDRGLKTGQRRGVVRGLLPTAHCPLPRSLPRLWGGLVDLVFPPCCGVCGAEGAFLCLACEHGLRRAAGLRCSRCWEPGATGLCQACAGSPTALDGARSVFVFEDGARRLVHGLKYRSLHALARPMGELMAEYLLQTPLPVDLLVPVPLHRWRKRGRGFNQAELLCRIIAERSGIALDARSLRRTRNTPQQTRSSDRAERELGMRGAFRCQATVAGRRVLLVDDVMTTGATLHECAGSLRAAGAASVWSLTFARADRGAGDRGQGTGDRGQGAHEIT